MTKTEPSINRTVLMSGAEEFDVIPLNPFSSGHDQISKRRAVHNFARIEAALKEAGIKVIKTKPPQGCQDGVFTANWGVCRHDTVVLSSLPPQRASESFYAEAALKDLGKRTIKAPYRFSGQGDALPCGNLLFAGSGFRTDPRMHQLLADELGFEVISLEAIPALDESGAPVINRLTGWPDSYFYDLDMAISILRKDLIAWCPEAFTPQSQEKIRSLDRISKIEVLREEAVGAMACNLVSTGTTVIMSSNAPELKQAIEAHGLATILVEAPELAKGGGGIRCTSLTLDNE